MTILLFPASLRKDSHQHALAVTLKALIGARCETEIVTRKDVDLPLYDQDIEQDDPWKARLEQLYERFCAASGVIFITPEHNGQVSAYLKNTVDWLSRPPRIDPRYSGSGAFAGKPILLAGATTGWSGALLALSQARLLLAYVGGLVRAEQICVSDADHWRSAEGFAFEPAFEDHIAAVTARFVEACEPQAVTHAVQMEMSR